MTGRSGRHIEFVKRRPDHGHAECLLQAFYDDQVSRYGFAEPVDLDPAQFAVPQGGFVIVYLNGEPVGCGGWRWHDRAAAVAEIKKTYLKPGVRGAGVGRALLTRLEQDAAAAGAEQAILETGVRNTAALNLFSRHGYEPIASYVPGRPPEINRAFKRSLTRARGDDQT